MGLARHFTPSKGSLSKDFQWPFHFSAKPLGGFVESHPSALALSIGERGWALSDKLGSPIASSVVLGKPTHIV